MVLALVLGVLEVVVVVVVAAPEPAPLCRGVKGVAVVRGVPPARPPRLRCRPLPGALLLWCVRPRCVQM